MQQVKEWYDGLEQNEQRIVLIASAFFALIILFFGVINPLNSSVNNLERQVKARKASVAKWQQAMPQLVSSGGQVTAGSSNQALSSIITSTTRRFNLRVSRVKENGANETQIWFDNIPFNDFIRWTAELEKTYQIKVLSANIRSKDRNGLSSMDVKIQKS
ncbi:type II secretion system protein GspM [Aliikangiella sp. IMCC44653]